MRLIEYYILNGCVSTQVIFICYGGTMNSQMVLTSVGKTILLTATQELSKKFVAYLKSIGLSEEEIQFLDTQGAMFYWAIILGDYISGKRFNSNYYLYNSTIFLADIMLESIHNLQLKKDMQNFVCYQDLDKALQIRTSMNNSISEENIHFLSAKMIDMLTKGA